MKPRKDLRPLTDIRVTRKSNIELAHGDSHGWAVSYADLLMVLLSFFVLYFSFAEDNPNTVNQQMQALALSMKGLSQKQIEQAVRKPDSIGQMMSLADRLKMDGVKVTQMEDHLLVELEESSFRSGSFDLEKPLRAQVDEVMTRLEPVRDKIAMTVIGHADKRKMIARNVYLSDNFDLSSLRALKVLKYILKSGFPANQAAARAAGSFDRDARSITFEIRMAKAPKTGETI